MTKHASQPFNPDIANAFFRAGEIEAWGRGIQRIFQSCREAGTPRPQLRLSGNDLWLEFPYEKDYLKAVSTVGGDGIASGKSSGKSSGKTEDMILAMVQGKSEISIPEMAATLGITPRAVEKQIRQLKARGRLRRVGPAKGGRWEVLS